MDKPIKINRRDFHGFAVAATISMVPSHVIAGKVTVTPVFRIPTI